MRVAIVADDLTGALDVCTPLAARGLRCYVATRPDGLEAALARGGDIVCVNTATRETDPEAARRIVGAVARRIAEASPAIAFKKIDSRLKGHVAIEVEACLAEFGRRRAILAPAVPSQGRRVEAGYVTGRGLAEPLGMAGVLGNRLAYAAPDSADEADLERIARADWRDVLLVGASGLAAGLAAVLSPQAAMTAKPINGPLLVAVGSHDPITVEQVSRAAAQRDVLHLTSDDGAISMPTSLPPVVIVQATIAPQRTDRAQAMVRFGGEVASLLRQGGFATALVSGGETGQTVLGNLGVDCLEVLGEALAGIPLTEARIGEHRLAILTKSGGFGTPDDIVRLAEIARQNMHPADTSIRGEHA
ncbi:four-carbon acid sugar kinase family protein [Devosia geojensis]|uniref:four-carbon acid sugar kinase family protein n=1 Tax=Devosia geojensis TaxID=443610 RepID=UPI001364A255|nr:four-carbon acid sugar kinase family protein [Devosia geojensis]